MTAPLAEIADRVVARAPGKINLYLQAGAPGADGYHPLATVFHAVSVHEDVSVTPNPGGGTVITIKGAPEGSVPLGPDNLAWRAADALARHMGTVPDVRIDITKGVPVAGGMGGGSADAAATLVALDALWGCDLAGSELAAIGAQLGADVPFCLMGGTAMGTGRGDELTPVLARGALHWVLAVADEGLSTPSVYQRLDELRDEPMTPPQVPVSLLQALARGGAAEIAAHLANDLQQAALDLRPSLQHTLDAGMAAGAMASLVSGSGPTVAFLVDSAQIAEQVAAEVAEVSGLVLTAHGPAPGARVIAH